MDFEKLKQMGVEEREVMSRFMNNEEFYGRVLKKFLEDKSYAELKAALELKDYETAFRAAHTLKGVSANLGLGNLRVLSSELTEQLRPENERDDQLVEARMSDLDTQYSVAMDIITNL